MYGEITASIIGKGTAIYINTGCWIDYAHVVRLKISHLFVCLFLIDVSLNRLTSCVG